MLQVKLQNGYIFELSPSTLLDFYADTYTEYFSHEWFELREYMKMHPDALYSWLQEQPFNSFWEYAEIVIPDACTMKNCTVITQG